MNKGGTDAKMQKHLCVEAVAWYSHYWCYGIDFNISEDPVLKAWSYQWSFKEAEPSGTKLGHWDMFLMATGEF